MAIAPSLTKRRRVNKWKAFDACGYIPHSGQIPIHDSKARHRLAACGRRFGKSRLGGMELVPEAWEAMLNLELLRELNEREYWWIVGPNYDDTEREWRVFWDACGRLGLRQIADRPGTYNDTVGGNMRMSLFGERFIVEGKSAAHPESLDGEGLKGVLMVEAAKMKPSTWTKYIRPALSDKRGKSISTSTPEGKNWFYDFYQRGQDPTDTEWESWRRPSWANPVIFPGGRDDPEILDMAKDMSQEKFNQQIGADFTEFVGRVFKDFDEEIHVGDFQYNPQLPLYAACDYGWTNPFVWILIQVDVWDNVYVLSEYRAIHRDINDISRDLLDWRGGLSTNARRFYPDPEAPSDTAVLAKVLRVRHESNTGGELKWRLELIRQHLKLGPEHAPFEQRLPKLFIDRSCTNPGPDGSSGVQEMLDYRWPDTKEESIRSEPEKPLDKNNHFPEALGRFFRGYFGGPAEAANVAVRRVNISRGQVVR